MVSKLIEVIAAHRWLSSLFCLFFSVFLIPIYGLIRFFYVFKFWFIFSKHRGASKKVVIFSVSHVTEIRYIEKLITKLKTYPKLAIVLFCGGAGLARDKLKSCFPDLSVYPYGILPLVRADLFLTTKSSLNWHRPFFTKKVHIFHSLASMHVIYPENSFDYFDAFFAMGPHHKYELGAYMPKRGRRDIEVFEIGSEVIDSLLLDKKEQKELDVRTVYYAPTWGQYSSLSLYGEKIIKQLLDMSLSVVLRPHPTSFKSERVLIDTLMEKFSSNNCFKLDFNEGVSFLDNSVDIMISDWSGIAFEFALGCHRPVIFIDSPQKVYNKNWRKYIQKKGIEFEYRDRIGCVIHGPEDLPGVIESMKTSFQAYGQKINDCSSELLYHFGQSSVFSYNAVLELIELK